MARHYEMLSRGIEESRHVLVLRHQLEKLLTEAMKRIDVTNVMTHAMTVIRGQLHIGKITYPIAGRRKIVLIAVGKAAFPMCNTAVAILQPILTVDQSISGIIVGPQGDNAVPEGFSRFDGGHPFPNFASREGAQAAIQMLSPLTSDDLVLFLVSGGASAMMEAPLDPKISVEQLGKFYKDLVHSGLPITEINTLRKHFSAVKGGRLALLAAPAMQCTLIISDVPGKAYDMVGSGPSLPDSSTVEDCRKILMDAPIRAMFDEGVLHYFDGPELCETPSQLDLPSGRSGCICLLSNQSLLEQVHRLATEAGFYTEIDTSCDDWDYREASAYLLQRTRTLRTKHSRVCLISGGEISVKVTEPSGIGGRNQHFALHSAMHLREEDPSLAMLSFGSDGVDGNSGAAGALIDSLTMDRIRLLNLDPIDALQRFDSHAVFDVLGDTVTTGPTGNNVRDVRIFLSA
jgi:glycerate 2-kinase